MLSTDDLLGAVTTQVVTVHGIELPFRSVNGYTKELRREGTVFVSMETLYQLAEQDVWDSQFGKVLLLEEDEGLALEAAGLAEWETRGGYHRTDLLREFLELYEKKGEET